MARSTRQKKSEPVVDKRLGFLKELDDSLWVTQSNGRSIGEYKIEKPEVYLTTNEWEHVQFLINAHDLICLPGSGVFGFGFSMGIYQQPEPAPFPGTEGAFQPEYLLCLTGKHMEKVIGANRGPALNDQWWKMLAPFCYSELNKSYIERFGLGPLRDRNYYEY